MKTNPNAWRVYRVSLAAGLSVALLLAALDGVVVSWVQRHTPKVAAPQTSVDYSVPFGQGLAGRQSI
jgi:hypothetical protein